MSKKEEGKKEGREKRIEEISNGKRKESKM